ncbi:hypothetical protein STEG23_017831, partial [Scotinomys teguina]
FGGTSMTIFIIVPPSCCNTISEQARTEKPPKELHQGSPCSQMAATPRLHLAMSCNHIVAHGQLSNANLNKMTSLCT